MKTIVLRNLAFPLGDLLFGQRMISRLKFLETAQWWDQDQIAIKQKEYLSRLIYIAYTEVPFYRKMMDDQKVNPKSINEPRDLLRIPIVTKEMIRNNYPQFMTRSTGQHTYEVSTSGSTGQNFIVKEDAFTAGWYRATLLLMLEWSGWIIGEPHLQTGMTLTRTLDRKLKDWILGCHYVSAFNLDDYHLQYILEIIEKHKLRHLWGYPGSLFYLARYAAKQGWNQPINSAVTWGDTLFPQYRKTIEHVFNTKVFDTYGCSEGFHIAAQCGVEDHYHVHNLDVIVDYVDNDDQPVDSGTPGNVIVTRLHPGPMPLIRYRVGDVAIPKSGVCSCGRGFELMSGIQGRDTDIVITPRGNRLIVHFFTGILEHFSEIDSFQVIQENRDGILINIVPNSEITSETEDRIIKALKRKGTDDLAIEIQVLNEIPITPSGKRRFVINNIRE